LSVAIRQFTQGSLCPNRPGNSTALVDSARTLPGRGTVATVGEIEGQIYLGSLRLMQEAGMQVDQEFRGTISPRLADGLTIVFLGWGGRVRGAFLFREQLRESALPAVADLQQAGCSTSVLTGDHCDRGRLLATQLGIPVLSEQLPEEKVIAIHQLKNAKGGLVAMVGDGINDAPALAAADVGIAMGCGADVSRDTADVCLLGNDLRLVNWSYQLARQTMRTVRQNLFWAFAYNVVGIGIAAAGWMNPIWAAAAMVASSLFVTTNSLRLTTDNASPSPVSQPSPAAPRLLTLSGSNQDRFVGIRLRRPDSRI
jgi:P-type E1-E2 ATPase